MVTHQNGVGSIILEIGSRIVDKPLHIIVLTLYWVWIDCVLQSTLFFDFLPTTNNIMAPSWIIPAFACAITLLSIALSWRFFESILGSTRLIIFGCTLMLISVILEIMRTTILETDSILDVLFLIITAFCAGSGTALGLVNSAKMFTFSNPREPFLISTIGVFASAAVCVAFYPFDHLQICIVLLFVPLTMGLAMIAWHRGYTTPKKQSPLPPLRFPGRLFCTSLLHGCSLGALFGLSIAIPTVSSNLIGLPLALVVSATTVLVLCFALNMTFNNLIYRVAFLVIATGSVIIMVLPDQSNLGSFVQLIGFCLLHLFMWGANCLLMGSFHFPISWLVSITTLGWMIGEIVFGLSSSFLVQSLSPDVAARGVEGVLVLLLMAGGLILCNEKNQRNAWGLVRPSSSQEIESPYCLAVTRVANEYHLTNREQEVLDLFGRGRDRKHISESLIVSEETIKSHLAAIYRKTAAHSQQELIDIIEFYLEE